MHSERANENMVECYSNCSCDQLDQCKDEQNDINAAYLKYQLQTDGIVLTKLQIPKWTPNIAAEQAHNSIMNTFYLGKQPILGQQQILEKQMHNERSTKFNKNEFLNQPILAPLNNSSILSNNSLNTMINYNSINSEKSIDSNYASNCHLNNGYISSNAHSIEYNHDYNDQNPYNSQSPINHQNTFDHSDSNKAAIKELLLPVILSGFGNMGAGVILDSAQKWNVFQRIPQLIVLVPALLGLKGNVEMTLSSRLGTCANLGELHDKKKRKSIVIGNISLAQCQASAVGLLAPFIAISFSYLNKDSSAENSETTQLTYLKTILILASSVMTSGLADLMLSSFMCFIVIMSVTKLRINADNIATPIAASVGDLATMGLFAIISKTLFTYSAKYDWLPMIPISIWLIIISFTGFVARRNQHTSKLIYTGWTTLMIAMLIQNTSGTVMETFFRKYKKMAAFQPIVNGFGGNLVAIQSSRIATYLHKTCKKRQLPETDPYWLVSPWSIFCGKNKHGNLAIILILIAGPLQIPYVVCIRYITGNATITPAFLITYYICCTVQVAVILYLGYMFVHFLWKLGYNPDNNAIPILTACADLIGSALFATGFQFLASIQDPNSFNDPDMSLLNQTNQTIASTVSSQLFNSTINSTIDSTIVSVSNQMIDTTTIANTLSTLLSINLTESTTVLSNLTELLNDQLINSTVSTML